MAVTGQLWEQYWASPDVETRNRLVVIYAPLVKWVVGRLSFQVREHFDAEDLVSYGVIGLIDAIERFDPSPGYKFETYAVRRIKGSIIDELRRLDTLPRRARDRAETVEEARTELQHSLGRAPTRIELASRSGMDVSDVIEFERYLSAVPISLEVAGHDALAPADDEDLESAAERLDAVAMCQRLRQAIAVLPERERTVIALYYLESCTLAQIGSVLGVTESRVSQLRSRGVKLLRGVLDDDNSAYRFEAREWAGAGARGLCAAV